LEILDLISAGEWLNGKRKATYESYIQWSKNNDSVIQVSYPRSGRHWIESIIKWNLLGKDGCADIQNFDPNNSKHYYFTHVKNWPAFDANGKYVYLIRDPRDVFVSFMYYRTCIKQSLTVEQSFNDYDFLGKEVKSWKNMLQVFIETDCIIIQYERMCLYPKIELNRIARFIGVDMVDNIDCRDNGHFIYYNPDKPWQPIKKPFESNIERYNTRCLTWQKNPRFTKKHFDIIWGALKDIIPYYGYLENGHSVNLLER